MSRNDESVPQESAEVTRLLRQALLGDADAQVLVAVAYRTAEGVPQDHTEAAKWFRAAADQGRADAQWWLGLAYRNAEGVARDYRAAAHWFRESADQGNEHALFWLGISYRNGQGVEQDSSRAIEYFRRAEAKASSGPTLGMTQLWLGLMYRRGEGVQPDHVEAGQWFRKAADQGNDSAMYWLGFMYRNAEGVPESQHEAARWFQHAAELGNSSAQAWLGRMFRDGDGVPQDLEEAAEWFRKGAEQEDADAQRDLAEMYRDGVGVPQDEGQAATWFRRAADQNDSHAQFSLGELYREGKGVPCDEEEAASWYRKAADDGHPLAQFELGRMYDFGHGVSQDHAEAAALYEAAAEAGLADAQFHIGDMYREGAGIAQDHAQATSWYEKAADQGHDDARFYLERMRRRDKNPEEDAGAVDQKLDAPGTGRLNIGAGSGAPPQRPSGTRGLDRVAGMRELKALLRREVVDYVRNPERHRRYGLSLPNGILLYGPPGCGKTYTSRLLAEELGHHFVEITPGDVASPYIHDTVKQIRTAFDSAAAQAPAVMFIDEFEAFVPPRGELGGFQQYKAEEVNEFLALLNGCSEKRILVIAATNLPENIDPAVRRTGRLDKLIYVGPPDLEARREMLALHLGTRPVSADLDLNRLAEKLDGYSASDIKFLVDQAARHAMEEEADIAPDSFVSAMAGITPSVPPEIADQYRSIQQRGN